LIWLLCVILWNFGFPNVPPVADVAAAIVLSYLSNTLNFFFNNRKVINAK